MVAGPDGATVRIPVEYRSRLEPRDVGSLPRPAQRTLADLLVYALLSSRSVTALDLRPAEAGANVAVTTPFDNVVFDRTSLQRGLCVAAPSQVVVDLMTAPGRGPAEAEALIEWMREHTNAWQA